MCRGVIIAVSAKKATAKFLFAGGGKKRGDAAGTASPLFTVIDFRL